MSDTHGSLSDKFVPYGPLEEHNKSTWKNFQIFQKKNPTKLWFFSARVLIECWRFYLLVLFRILNRFEDILSFRLSSRLLAPKWMTQILIFGKHSSNHQAQPKHVEKVPIFRHGYANFTHFQCMYVTPMECITSFPWSHKMSSWA